MSEQNNNNQKYNDLGKEVRDSVINAINSGDFSGLSNSVSKTVYTVLGDVGDSINKAAMGVNLSETQKHYREQMDKAHETARRYHAEQEAKIQRNKEMRASQVRKPNPPFPTSGPAPVAASAFKAVGMIKGPIKTILGAMGLFFSMLLLVGAFVDADYILGTIVFFILGGSTGLLLASGIQDTVLLGHARHYQRILGNRKYCSIDEFVSATGRGPQKVIKEVKKILTRGYFPEGYIDKDCTTFMNSRKVYDEYLKQEKYKREHPEEYIQKEETPVAETINNPSGIRLSPEQQAELDIMIADGQNAIKRLHELNDDIPGEAITAKLYTTEGLLNDIFNRVREHPDQMKKCHKLMNYHLPTMLKLVEAYAEYDKVSVPGPEIIKAKEEIEKTMDVINQAFIELLNRMFQDSIWDVTADAQVLKSMLTQEGLAKDIVVEPREE